MFSNMITGRFHLGSGSGPIIPFATMPREGTGDAQSLEFKLVILYVNYAV